MSSVHFLGRTPPALAPDWWPKHVVNVLTYPQQRAVEQKDIKTLSGLDLPALLRVLDQSWYEIGRKASFRPDARYYVTRQLQRDATPSLEGSAKRVGASKVDGGAESRDRPPTLELDQPGLTGSGAALMLSARSSRPAEGQALRRRGNRRSQPLRNGANSCGKRLRQGRWWPER